MNPLRITRRGRARAAYFKAGKKAYRTLGALEQAPAIDPTVRGRLLHEYAALEYLLGEYNAAGWREETFDDGHTLTNSHYDAARLVELVASTETAGSVALRDTESVWEDALGPVLDQLTTVSDPAIRAELMNRLYLAAHPLLGGQAAETIEALRTAYLRLALNHPAGNPAKH